MKDLIIQESEHYNYAIVLRAKFVKVLNDPLLHDLGHYKYIKDPILQDFEGINSSKSWS